MLFWTALVGQSRLAHQNRVTFCKVITTPERGGQACRRI
jgi:hypothetical protein